MTIARFAAKALIAFQTTLALSAAVIYDGGPPNGASSLNVSLLVVAQQFTLTNAATLQGLILYDTNFSNLPNRFGGTIGFRFLSDNAGTPGTSQALGSDPTVQLINNRILVNLGSIPLGAGTYWLAVHEGAMGTPSDGSTVFWNTTASAPAGVADVRFTSDLNGLSGYSTFNTAGLKGAFQLLDAPAYNPIPEPSTWVLMLSAGGFLLLLRRR